MKNTTQDILAIASSARFVFLFFTAILLPRAVGAQQKLAVVPTSVVVQANAGANAPSQTVRVSKSGNRALKWWVAPPNGGWPTWLTVTPASGANSGTLTLSFNTSSLSPGAYPATSFTVEAPAGTQGSPAAVTVMLTIVGSGPPPPPSSASGVGPQSTITCPPGAVSIPPGSSVPYIQSLIDGYPGRTTFCFRVGVHYLDRSLTPKTGNTFVGEYGAILDGTGWATINDSEAAFRAHDRDIDSVTIRNLVIRNLRRGIHGFGPLSDHWTIEYNELASNYSGIVFPSASTVRNNYIHHNSYGGYVAVSAHSSTLENNEIAYNGWEQKITLSANVTFRNNFVHHNVGTGIWYDSDNTGALVEGNRVEDNGNIGIFYEVSSDAIIRNNTIRRSGDAGVMLSVSKNTQIYGNTLESNFRGITYFLNCASVGGGSIVSDLANITAHDNTITVGTRSGAFASVLTYAGSCTPAEVEPYSNGSKNLTFSHNTYNVPSPTTAQYWYFWSGLKYWNEWQAIPQDATGTVSQ